LVGLSLSSSIWYIFSILIAHEKDEKRRGSKVAGRVIHLKMPLQLAFPKRDANATETEKLPCPKKPG